MKFPEYKAIPALNATIIKAGAKSMRAMRHEATVGREQTKALTMGTALHQAVLEPDEWASVLTFSGTRNTNAYKALFAANPEALILSVDEHDEIQRAADYMAGCADVQELLAGTEREVTIQWNDAEIGAMCKSRIDAVRRGTNTTHPVIVELKTARELGENCRAFIRQSEQLHYHLQLAFYGRGFRTVYGVNPQILVLAVQVVPFCDHSIMPVDPYQMNIAEAKCVDIARRYLACCKAGVWQGVGNAPFVVSRYAAGMEDVPELEDMERMEAVEG